MAQGAPETDAKEVPVRKAKESLADKAYRAIEELILAAELAPGAWIAEAAIAERTGFGRTPVREAIQRLARHHLVEISTGRRLRVADLDVRDQLLIVELRREIELLLVRRATRHALPAEREEFRAMAAAIAAAGRGELAAFYRLDLEFKLLLLRVARHRFAAEAIMPLWSVSRRFSWMYRTADDTAAVAEMLQRLARAIAAGAEAEAVQATQERMEYLDGFARATLDRKPDA